MTTLNHLHGILQRLDCALCDLPADVRDSISPIEGELVRVIHDLLNRNEYLQRQHADRESLAARLCELVERKESYVRQLCERLDGQRRQIRKLRVFRAIHRARRLMERENRHKRLYAVVEEGVSDGMPRTTN